MPKVFRKIFGSRNDRLIKQYRSVVEKINKMEPDFEKLSDDQLKAKTEEFKNRLANKETLEDLLPEAFATVREASRRVLSMRHFDVQMIGGIVLHNGKISEMRTGEGKTLVATLPAYLNALTGKGVHIVTVNDYLATRDSEWMGQIYEFLGLTTGLIVSQISPQQRKEAYLSDITYGTNNEFGFDYLRDNMAFRAQERVQRELNYAIVDEVDSILIDEARTPLVISGAAEDSSELYQYINKLIPKLRLEKNEGDGGHFTLDEKSKQIHMTEAGHEEVEKLLEQSGLIHGGSSLYDVKNISLLHHVTAALRAHNLFTRDVDYIVRNNEVTIVDEFTGRTMEGRRWSDGLHQAVEAKEGVKIQNENQTLASITYQNYFRIYNKISGMTGTADTEAPEFLQIYGLEVVVVPTHMQMIRNDMPDQVYLTTKEKFDALISDIKDKHKKGQPVLVGTASIEASEHISKLLKKNKIRHQVLNAKFHEKEAHIVARAGEPGAVTIATNMAGRGTDIVLGGSTKEEIASLGHAPAESLLEKIQAEWKKRHEAVLAAGGLHIIGTERHESRRIDNQLRGRSGRQGDPGSSRFYLSLEDNLMRIFASDKVASLMQKLGMQEGESIEHPWVTKAIANAQKKVEAHNFDIRKTLLEYDDVANDQRKVIYQQRNELMTVESITESIDALWHEQVALVCSSHIPAGSLEEQWNQEGLEKKLFEVFGINIPVRQMLEEDHSLYEETLIESIHQQTKSIYDEKRKLLGNEISSNIEKDVMLSVLDTNWKDHLASMDYLRQGIGLRGYAQKNPKQEYKKEAFNMFSDMLDSIKRDVITILARLDVEQILAPPPIQPTMLDDDEHRSVNPQQAVSTKVRRNDPCPCGSGKKYKHCHGRVA
ncbi:MAG: preprotein translocase subunit SecA [Gammaproteobacteria bacterium]|nr:MAG: preprotein translocase subunit SecA [Gammaproteobacteria bacterium]